MRIRRHPTEAEILERALQLSERRGLDEPLAEEDLREARAELEAEEAAAESHDLTLAAEDPESGRR